VSCLILFYTPLDSSACSGPSFTRQAVLHPPFLPSLRILIASIMEEYNKGAWEELIERCEETGVDGFEINFR
jgi:hypothetical protein